MESLFVDIYLSKTRAKTRVSDGHIIKDDFEGAGSYL